jgi:hypothetical protein
MTDHPPHPDTFERLTANALDFLAHRIVQPELRATGGRCVPRALLIEQRESDGSWRLVVLPITAALATRSLVDRRPELRLALTSQRVHLGCLVVPMPPDVGSAGAVLVDFWSALGEHRMASIRWRPDVGTLESAFEPDQRRKEIDGVLATMAARTALCGPDAQDATAAFGRNAPSIADAVAHLNSVAGRCAHLAAKVRRRNAERAERALDARVLASRIETLEKERDALRRTVEALRRRVDVDRALAEVRGGEAAIRSASAQGTAATRASAVAAASR